MIEIPTKENITAEIAIPGSKSITNRGLVIGALARGETKLINRLECEDTEVMISCLRNLGFTIFTDGDCFLVRGEGGLIPARQAQLNTENSGTTMRFLTSLASLGNGKYILDGSPRMRERPIEDLLDGLNSLGVTVHSVNENGCPPVSVRANGISGGGCRLAGDISSQYLSSILLCAPYAGEEVTIKITGELVSRPYVDMTIRMMREFGVSITEDEQNSFTIPPGQKYEGRTYAIEGDASSASYFWAAAAITGGRVKVNNIGDSSIQGDAGFPRILEEMGATIKTGPDWTEVAGPVTRGIKIDLNEMPDMVLTLAITSLFAPGRTVITNVANLRYKESDRLKAITVELKKIGAIVEELPDGLVIEGGDLHGAEIDTYNDHRIAMAFSLAGLRVPGIKIKNPGCVNKTFPSFFDLFLNL